MDEIERAILEKIAIKWHRIGDHGHHYTPFNGPRCECMRAASRLAPWLAEVWDEGYEAGEADQVEAYSAISLDDAPNPYRWEARR